MNTNLTRIARFVSYAARGLRARLAELAAMVGPCGLVLDVGSGSSTPYRNLFHCGSYVTLDRFERADILGDAEALPIPSERADLILCTEVLEHLPEPLRALREMSRVLVDEGHLVLTVPLIWGEHDHVDHHRWTEAGLRRLLDSAAFEIQIIRRRGGIFSMIGCMITQIPHQVFGKLDDQRSWLLKALYAFCWLLTVPVPWILAPFDRLDRKRAFTIGYTVLCRKCS
jgi:SAM-dependent methyltransferase